MANRKLKGFTLAEVLITLTIIGIIAVLTIPNLIAKHDKEVTVTKLKKVYTTLSQALAQIELNDPDVLGSITSPYDARVYTTLDEKIRPYLKVEAKCNKSLGENMNASECRRVSAITYKQLNGNASTSDGLTRTGRFIILDDSTIIMYGNQGPTGSLATSITVDINGTKGPNTFGKDTFIFGYYITSKQKQLVPYLAGLSSWDLYNVKRSDIVSPDKWHSCSKNGSGRWCSALMMKDGWQIKDDYPW